MAQLLFSRVRHSRSITIRNKRKREETRNEREDSRENVQYAPKVTRKRAQFRGAEVSLNTEISEFLNSNEFKQQDALVAIGRGATPSAISAAEECFCIG